MKPERRERERRKKREKKKREKRLRERERERERETDRHGWPALGLSGAGFADDPVMYRATVFYIPVFVTITAAPSIGVYLCCVP